MELKIKKFDELTPRELYEIIRARESIFLLEQNIVCQDLDRVDYRSLHFFLEDGGQLLAYMRAYVVEDGVAKIGRVLSMTHGIGLGTAIMNGALPEIKKRLGCKKIMLHAQSHAKEFYAGFGFVETSSEFMEEGVPHVEMTLFD